MSLNYSEVTVALTLVLVTDPLVKSHPNTLLF